MGENDKTTNPSGPPVNPFPQPTPVVCDPLRKPTFLEQLTSLWKSVRGNPILVAFEGGATGAALNFLYDECSSGQLDFTKAGLKTLAISALTGGITAVRLLYRPVPATNKESTGQK